MITPATASRLRTPEELFLSRVISVAEADMSCHNKQNRFPGRGGGEELFGYCGSATFILGYFAKLNGVQSRYYQSHDLHGHFSGDLGSSGPVYRQSFAHALGIASVGRALFLTDMTFGQFCAGDTIRQFDYRDTGVPSDHPIARALIRDCYVPLDDDSLREYLRLTSCDGEADRSYIDTASVDVLLRLPTLQSDIPDAEVESGYEYHMPRYCEDFSCPRPDPVIAC